MSLEIVSAEASATGCRVHHSHAPEPKVFHRHHVVPRSWGGGSGETVDVCPTGHYNVHHLIDAYVRAGGDPGWDVRKHYGPFERSLAERAWEGRPDDHPPLTLEFAS